MHGHVDVEWSHGRARLHSTAAMLTDLTLETPHGPRHPLAAATWTPDDPAAAQAPAHVRVLGGDFIALPFGSTTVPADAPPAWRRVDGPANTPAHGLPADADWRLRHDPATNIAHATFVPSAGHAIERLQRTVRGVPGRARVEFTLEATARVSHRTSLGLHPILALPENGHARIDVDFEAGRAWPGRLHARSRPLPDAVFSRLDAVPTSRGRADLSIVPAPHPTEEVVQLVGARSPFRLRHDDGTTVVVEWDDGLLPSLLLWLSDRSIDEAPWRGRYRGLGVEPIASAFDFGLATSLADNPLARAGALTALSLEAGRTLRTHHAIEVLV